MKGIKRIWLYIKHGIKHNMPQILITIIIVLVLFLTTKYSNQETSLDIKNLENWWGSWFDPVIGASTFFIAMLIWFTNLKKNWEENLPKKLTVHFKYKGKYIMSCHEAYLAGEGDIRPWAQQIGSQMADVRQLFFYPYFTQKICIVDCDTPYKLYDVTIYLRKHPLSGDTFDKSPSLNESYLIWFDNHDNTPENEQLYIEGHPDNLISIEEVKKIWRNKSVNDQSAQQHNND